MNCCDSVQCFLVEEAPLVKRNFLMKAARINKSSVFEAAGIDLHRRRGEK